MHNGSQTSDRKIDRWMDRWMDRLSNVNLTQKNTKRGKQIRNRKAKI